ncbi:MAG TPA: YraN family protein [Candidatus Limnocylindrales bacterium]|nr:YraN family protein [Candidatus Limnocylindrales bacterium]
MSVACDRAGVRTAAQQVGDAAEALVADRLTAAGWTILGRQVRVGRAELDLVALDPRGTWLVIVEVRWRSRRDYGLAEETVDRAKLARLRRAAFSLLEIGHLPDGVPVPRLPLRFDLVVVEPRGVVRHHANLGSS